MVGEGLVTPQSAVVDHQHLARVQVADELGADEVEGAGFAARTQASPSFPRERGGTERIAHADEVFLREDNQRVGAFDAAEAGLEEILVSTLPGAAIRWRMISLSTVVWKIEPWVSSSSRRAAALVRLPLCAMASWPRAQSTVSGWALRTWIRRWLNSGCGRWPHDRPGCGASAR